MDEVGGVAEEEIELLEVILRGEVGDEGFRRSAVPGERFLTGWASEAVKDQQKPRSVNLDEALRPNPVDELRGYHLGSPVEVDFWSCEQIRSPHRRSGVRFDSLKIVWSPKSNRDKRKSERRGSKISERRSERGDRPTDNFDLG